MQQLQLKCCLSCQDNWQAVVTRKVQVSLCQVRIRIVVSQVWYLEQFNNQDTYVCIMRATVSLYGYYTPVTSKTLAWWLSFLEQLTVSDSWDNNMVLHVQSISKQGIFNENLRRSFEKLNADKSDIKKEKMNQIFRKSNLQVFYKDCKPVLN